MIKTVPEIDVNLPDKFSILFEPLRYKVFYGGRGGAKSWSMAKALIIQAYLRPLRILCCREFQTSIADSVMSLLVDQIHTLGLDPWFTISRKEILAYNGSRFIFMGLRINPQEIKSLEGIDIAWVEEAQSVSSESWEVLRPTIRKEGSEIWVSFNTKNEKDPTYVNFVTNCPPEGKAVLVNYYDNPFLPATLDAERRAMLNTDPDAYKNIWLGKPRRFASDLIFREKFEVLNFETPEDVRFFHGLDFGFADDPTAGIRCYILDDCLFIDQEAYGLHIELDDLYDFLIERIPTFATWPVKADNARPETISLLHKNKTVFNADTGKLMTKQGLNIKAAAKWAGCVEDRIQYLRGFKTIYIHEKNCPNTAQEFELYRYKTDKLTEEILPVPIDKHNHAIDALGYSMDEYILAKMNVNDIYKAYAVESPTEKRIKIAESMNKTKGKKTPLGTRRAGSWVQ